MLTTITGTDPRPRRTALVVFHEGILGGATLSVLRLVPLLADRGWRIHFWVPRPSELYEHLEAAGHPVAGAKRTVSYSLVALRLAPGPRARLVSMPPYFAALARHARSLRPDLAHVNSLTTIAEGAVLRGLRIPVVAHIHEMLGAGPKAAAARYLVASVGTRVVGVSAACSAALAVGRHRPETVHEAAPLPAEVPDRSGREGPFTVGSVGVLSRRKGTDTFVEAAALARRRNPGMRFRLIGAATDPLDRDWANGVLRRASAAGVEHVERADIPAALAAMDAFALPSRRDPFPIAMLEAMASGLPVVGSDADGIPEQLDGGRAGMVVPADDPAALADALLKLAGDPALRERLGSAARERVARRFTLERQAAGLAAVWGAATA